MARFVKVLQSLGLLVARLGLGVILITHGMFRWRGPGQGVQQQIDYLTQFGTPYPVVAGWAAVIFELVAGLFLIAGAFTPVVGLAVLAEQILVVAYTSWYKGLRLLNDDGTYRGGYEYTVALGLLGLLFFVFGAGAVSVDQLFRRKQPELEDEVVDSRPGASAYASR